jgi:hypothetical protein
MLAFAIPLLFISLAGWGVLAVLAQVATRRASRRAHQAIERTAAEASSVDSDVVVLAGRLRVDGEGCFNAWRGVAKVAAKSVVLSRRRVWPEELKVGGASMRCARLSLVTSTDVVSLEGPLVVELGSRLRFKGLASREGRVKHFGAETALFDGDEVVALGLRQREPVSVPGGDGGYRTAAARDVLGPLVALPRARSSGGEELHIVMAARRTRAPLFGVSRHPVMVLVIGAALVPSCRAAEDYRDKEQHCRGSCDQHGECGVVLRDVSKPREVWQRLAQSNWFTCGAGDDALCRRSFRCLTSGHCSAVDGNCAAGNDEDCRHTDDCIVAGRCSAVAGSCVAARDEDCRATDGCRELGRCGAVAGGCRPKSDADCAASYFCAQLGHCSLDGDSCRAKSRSDCLKSEACEILGHCSAENGECKLGSNADCQRTDKCRQRGQCTFRDRVVRECIAADDADCMTSEECASMARCRVEANSCIRDDGRCITTRACTVHGRCEGDVRCSAVSQRDCEQSEGCKTKGACRLLAGRCITDCAATTECKKSGSCSEIDGRCQAVGDSDCRRSAACRKDGACTAVDGRCVAMSDAECKASRACREYGRCTAEDGQCVAAGHDCIDTPGCRNGDMCLAERGGCNPGGADERCRRSPLCKELGKCSWGSYRCVAGSAEDCRQSTVCQRHGWCDKVDNHCFLRP